ncbi:hypothetical protein AVEN_165172-1 [Araneus ventricosus]|uniref:Uncharacterized protein n=1 Tax=Araneus ventricosus TaxID=182803 RepID=A0A4Y2B8C1_ARAVE|nr:hypothetical protein AVEN_165172-1 [Araneus ventricosus]
MTIAASSDTKVGVLTAVTGHDQPNLKEVRIISGRGRTPAIIVLTSRSENPLTYLTASHTRTRGALRWDMSLPRDKHNCACHLKPAIHLKVFHAICPKPVFSPPIFIEKSRHVIHLRLQSALAVGERSSFPLPPLFDSPTPQISDFLASKRGLNLVRSFDVPPTLTYLLGPKLESAHEVLDFDFVGIPASPSRYANFHRFIKLTISFSFPCSKNSCLEKM